MDIFNSEDKKNDYKSLKIIIYKQTSFDLSEPIIK